MRFPFVTSGKPDDLTNRVQTHRIKLQNYDRVLTQCGMVYTYPHEYTMFQQQMSNATATSPYRNCKECFQP